MPSLNNSERRRDAYYTPEGLAREVVAAAQVDPRVIMDPSVGDGSLLRAAADKWPRARILGLDIARRQLERTRACNSDWSLGRIDMFSGRSRAASPIWHTVRAEVDLLLLNPPFSYRGGRSKEIEHEGTGYRLTPASAFVGLSLSRLSAGGELLALLPAGVLSLERDAAFWEAVAGAWEVETVAEYSSTAFRGTRTRSVLVAVRPRAVDPSASILDLRRPRHTCVEVVRGRVPLHRLGGLPTTNATAPFLHTRDLAALTGRATTSVLAPADLATEGPFLTLPRVGRVLESHMKILSDPQWIVLSDCVFALRTTEASQLSVLRNSLTEELKGLEAEYVGGCAPYLTLRRLIDFLSVRGYCCHHVPASSHLGDGVRTGSVCPSDAWEELAASAENR